MAEPVDAWKRLENEPDGPPGVRRTRIHGDAPLDLHALIDMPSRRVGIAIEVASFSAASTRAYASAGAFRTRVEQLDGGRTRVSIVLEHSEFRGVFGEMCADLVRWCLLAGPDERKAVDTLRDRLDRWRDLFRGNEPRPLGEREQIGLFGELVFLELLLRRGARPDAAVVAWQGPLGAPHDFHLGPTHVEVKSSVGGKPRVVHIAGLNQLEVAPAAELLLCHYVLDPVSDALGMTLAAQVRTVRALLVDARLLANLDDLLLRLGYLESHVVEHYDVVPFTHGPPACATVAEGFPSLTRANVPPAVVEARYELDLSKVTALTMASAVALEERIATFISAIT